MTGVKKKKVVPSRQYTVTQVFKMNCDPFGFQLMLLLAEIPILKS